MYDILKRSFEFVHQLSYFIYAVLQLSTFHVKLGGNLVCEIPNKFLEVGVFMSVVVFKYKLESNIETLEEEPPLVDLLP